MANRVDLHGNDPVKTVMVPVKSAPIKIVNNCSGIEMVTDQVENLNEQFKIEIKIVNDQVEIDLGMVELEMIVLSMNMENLMIGEVVKSPGENEQVHLRLTGMIAFEALH
jgi:hypothetical protein